MGHQTQLRGVKIVSIMGLIALVVCRTNTHIVSCGPSWLDIYQYTVQHMNYGSGRKVGQS